jgi:DNA-binding transcriptional ArsR family regulator
VGVRHNVSMIRLRLAAGDFTQMRFGFSPITELVDSLDMLHANHIDPLYQDWAKRTRTRIRGLDDDLLRAVVPHRGMMPDFPVGDAGAATTIEQQLQLLADWPVEALRAELEAVWPGCDLPPAAQQLIAAGPAGVRRLADVFWAYWEAALEPYWPRMRAIVEGEVAYRARQLTHGGLAELIADLHPQLELDQDGIRINKPHQGDYHLVGTGVLLMPCVFAPANVVFGPPPPRPSLIYRPRGVATLWEAAHVHPPADDPLGALIGRSRVAILRSTGLPKSTTELARELGQAVATVSVHLSMLRRCGMIHSWRSGRSVLHQRTTLATSVLDGAGMARGAGNQ